MSKLIKAYKRLLVDIVELSGVSLDAPDEISYEWVLREAPKLEKQCLLFLEGVRPERPDIPEWLAPLWDIFIATNDAKFLRYIRCLLLFCYKAEIEPTNEQLEEAQASFEETDRDIGTWNCAFKSTLSSSFVFRSARQYIGRVIGRIDWSEIKPSHGPGSVFPPCKPSEKSRFLTYYPSIQQFYPYDKYYWSLPSFWDEIMVRESKGSIAEHTDIVANLVAVPKDSRGPRLICVHPKESIWVQQGQRLLLERAIGLNPLTRGKINFTDQTVNGRLALASSVTRSLTTLDLKEASDRISCDAVKSLFGDYVYSLLSCSRANKIQLLDGRVIELQKWAPMGNCLTFPVQSLIFWSMVRAGIRSHYGLNCDDIYVFGDDILFPSEYYDGALRGLTMLGCVPNMGKTFRRGFFRESCGVDAYNGIDVTPYRMKKQDVRTAEDALAFLDLAKRLRRGGFEHCASYLYKEVSKRFGRLPLSNNPNAQGLVEYVDRDWVWLMLNESKMRFNARYHTWGVPCRTVSSVLEYRVKDDWYHLSDSLHRIAHRCDEFSDRGTQYPVPYRTRLTYGWTDCLMGS